MQSVWCASVRQNCQKLRTHWKQSGESYGYGNGLYSLFVFFLQFLALSFLFCHVHFVISGQKGWVLFSHNITKSTDYIHLVEDDRKIGDFIDFHLMRAPLRLSIATTIALYRFTFMFHEIPFARWQAIAKSLLIHNWPHRRQTHPIHLFMTLPDALAHQKQNNKRR